MKGVGIFGAWHVYNISVLSFSVKREGKYKVDANECRTTKHNHARQAIRQSKARSRSRT